MRLEHKLILAPVIAIASLVVLGNFDSWILSRSSQGNALRMEERVRESQTLAEVQQRVSATQVDVYRTMNIIGTLDQAVLEDKIGAYGKRIDGMLQELEGLAAAQARVPLPIWARPQSSSTPFETTLKKPWKPAPSASSQE